MSTYKAPLSDVDRKRGELEKQNALKKSIAAHRGDVLTHDLLELGHRIDPYSHRKSIGGLISPFALTFLLGKNCLVATAVLAAKEQPPSWPNPEDPKAIAKFALEEFSRPVIRDFATQLFLRIYEGAAIKYLSDDDPVDGGRWVRDPKSAALQAAEIAAGVTEPSDSLIASVGTSLSNRTFLALHAATRIAPRPALLMNAAMFTVEELDLGLSALYRLYSRAELRSKMSDSQLGADGRRIATRRLEELEVAHPPAQELPVLIRKTGVNLAKMLLSVAAEMIGSGLGTFVWPGWGTMVVGMVGGGAIQIII